ncbi:MAG TPA: hypothetical protein VH083_14975 [Myxococcales bacterium]|jgi:hypothetical protein|nr:hypothetical protein [Myxococcales bacterium]
MPASSKDQQYLQNLVSAERPARMLGLFTGHAMKPPDLQRLVNACAGSMREDDANASLTLAQLGDATVTWRLTVVEGTESPPHDCLVQLYDLRDPASPHRALLDHVGKMDDELSAAASHLQQTAQTFLTLASGKLDAKERVHAFQNLVALFTSALGAAIVDPAAAIVTTDPAEWADAMEQSLALEQEMGMLKR